MRNASKVARPAARKASANEGNGNEVSPNRGKKTLAVAAVTRKSEPIIAMVNRTATTSVREIAKKPGELPVPIATFIF